MDCGHCGHPADKHLAGRFTIILPGGELVPDPWTVVCVVGRCLCVGGHDFGSSP